MADCYRFVRALSYTATVSVTVLALAGLAGCSQDVAERPAPLTVGGPLPQAWPSPRPGPGEPQIQAMHFSSLDVGLGQDWSGQIVATADTSDVELATNLYWIHVPRSAPGRFAFTLHLFDVPAFLIRSYDLHVIAHGPNGRETQTTVPFRIRGRSSS